MRQFTWTCGVCGAVFKSRRGESWDEFNERLWTAHTRHHLLAGDVSMDGFIAFMRSLSDPFLSLLAYRRAMQNVEEPTG